MKTAEQFDILVAKLSQEDQQTLSDHIDEIIAEVHDETLAGVILPGEITEEMFAKSNIYRLH